MTATLLMQNLPILAKRASFIVAFFFAGYGINATVLALPAAADSFVVDGNKGLNTHNGMSIFDTQPRVSQWDSNPNHPDQQFDRIQGNRGGTLLKSRSTGKCLNGHYLQNGSQLNTWGCDANDIDQNWNLNDLGNGYNQIQRTGTNFCVDSPTRDNNGIIHLISCDRNNSNQRWKRVSPVVVTNNRDTPFLPFDPGVTLPVTQAYSGSHLNFYPDYNKFAVDFGAAGRNVSARASRYGTVTYAGFKSGGYGNVVEVRYSDGRYGRYMHLESIYVRAGENVVGGRGLGKIGSTGNSTGVHLHYAESNSSFGYCVPLPAFADAPNVNWYNSNFNLTSANPDGRG